MTATEAPRLFFMHIMKTAGTSLSVSLNEHYPACSVYPAEGSEKSLRYWNYDHLLSLSPEQQAEIRLLHGHYPLFVGRAVGIERTITILRDPIERLISLLRQITREHPAECPTIERAYELGDGEFNVRNFQIRQFCRTADDNPDVLDRTDLAQAIENLDRIELLGFTDRYAEFVDSCRDIVGPAFTSDHRLQVSEGTITVDPGFRRFLESENELDVEFYEHARSTRG